MVLVQVFYKTSKPKPLQSSPKPVPKSLINPRHSDTAQPPAFLLQKVKK